MLVEKTHKVLKIAKKVKKKNKKEQDSGTPKLIIIFSSFEIKKPEKELLSSHFYLRCDLFL